MFDFFAVGALPAPDVSEAEAAAVAAEYFGLAVAAESLGSQQDATFLLSDDDGPCGVLKISNPELPPEQVGLAAAAADRLASARPDLRVSVDIGHAREIELHGVAHTARVIAFLPGGTLHGDRYLSPAVVARLGELAAWTTLALADFDHPALDAVLQWDLRHAARVLDELAEHVDDEMAAAADAALAALGRVADLLPVQPIHGDLSDDNVVRDGSGTGVDGVIDLGDVMRSWRVAELAVMLASMLHHDSFRPAAVLPAVVAFDAASRLSDAEISALWPLVVLRAVTLVASGRHQVQIDAGNEYALEGTVTEHRIFTAATSVPSAVMTALVRETLRPAGPPPAAGGSVWSRPAPDVPPVLLDLTVEAGAFDDGAWLDAAMPGRLAAEALHAGADLVVGPFGAVDVTRAEPLASLPSATVRTGIDIWAVRDRPMLAPWPGAVTVGDDGIRLTGPDGTLILRGAVSDPAVGGATSTGRTLAMLAPGIACRMTVLRPGVAADLVVPDFVSPDVAPGWTGVLADPGPLVGAPVPAPAADADELARRRDAVLSGLQERYWAHPPRIERGFRHHLLTSDARALLDMVNNVTVLGHGDPRVARASAEQWRRLNTNSRFHYEAIVGFAERLTTLLPEPLDTVFLVNSGSEATDLALRIAAVATGRPDVIAVREAYHGWTMLADAVSTSTADNPRAEHTRPPWVHVVDAPNAYRGRYRGASARRYGSEAAAAVRRLAVAGTPAGAFIAEPVFGNGGGVLLPDGYLAAIYSAVRESGGLAISDEVQVGLGRLGHWFWGFEQQGVVPDLVAVAKSLGNGHPLGAVVTTRAIADRFGAEGPFFSSTGGSPVSAAVGSVVLDAIVSDDLPGNARRVGDALRAGLERLAERHPIIGAVHGAGLFLGVELVRDRATAEPATTDAVAICDRLLELGIVVQPTGDGHNVLKIKPPMCIDLPAAEAFLAALDRVLTTGW